MSTAPPEHSDGVQLSLISPAALLHFRYCWQELLVMISKSWATLEEASEFIYQETLLFELPKKFNVSSTYWAGVFFAEFAPIEIASMPIPQKLKFVSKVILFNKPHGMWRTRIHIQKLSKLEAQLLIASPPGLRRTERNGFKPWP